MTQGRGGSTQRVSVVPPSAGSEQNGVAMRFLARKESVEIARTSRNEPVYPTRSSWKTADVGWGVDQ